jgi:hypothetical protein
VLRKRRRYRRLRLRRPISIATVNITYNGSAAAPTNAGNYTVIGTVTHTNYQGSTTNMLVVSLPPVMIGSPSLSGGLLQFDLTSSPGASFTVLTAAEPNVPLGAWGAAGTMTEGPAGRFQFTDLQTPNSPQRFYRVRSP